nr:10663_t:CDS:2 [Entrophospora candida]
MEKNRNISDSVFSISCCELTDKTFRLFNDSFSPYQSTKSRHDIFVYWRFAGLLEKQCNECQKNRDKEYERLRKVQCEEIEKELKDEEVKKEKSYLEEAKKRGVVNCLYEYFRNAPKKLKVVCDWDEVIQPLEPKVYYEFHSIYTDKSTVGGCIGMALGPKKIKDKVDKIKNETDFYEHSPFLTLAKELLKLVKENKVEVVFLSAYDKKTFPNGDPRKEKIFRETFGKFPNCSLNLVGFESEGKGQSKSE